MPPAKTASLWRFLKNGAFAFNDLQIKSRHTVAVLCRNDDSMLP